MFPFLLNLIPSSCNLQLEINKAKNHQDLTNEVQLSPQGNPGQLKNDIGCYYAIKNVEDSNECERVLKIYASKSNSENMTHKRIDSK